MDETERADWAKSLKDLGDKIGPWEDIEACLMRGLADGLEGKLDPLADVPFYHDAFDQVSAQGRSTDSVTAWLIGFLLGENPTASAECLAAARASGEDEADPETAQLYITGYWLRRAGLPHTEGAGPHPAFLAGYAAAERHITGDGPEPDYDIPLLTPEQIAAARAQDAALTLDQRPLEQAWRAGYDAAKAGMPLRPTEGPALFAGSQEEAARAWEDFFYRKGYTDAASPTPWKMPPA